MLTEAAKEHGIDLRASWMVGDGLVDVKAGRAAGCHTILLTKLKLYHVERFFDMKTEPDAVAGNFQEVVEIIAGTMRAKRFKE
jgi:histidinol phosphatase-like enzyme